jgi:hypothetical protein
MLSKACEMLFVLKLFLTLILLINMNGCFSCAFVCWGADISWETKRRPASQQLTQVWNFYLGMKFLPMYEVSTYVWRYYLGRYEFFTHVWSFYPYMKFLPMYVVLHRPEVYAQVWSFAFGMNCVVNISSARYEISYQSKKNFITGC